MAIFSLVLAGTAGAFGYGSMISNAPLPVLSPIIKATNQPIKIAPASNEPHAKNAANASQVDTVTTGSIEKLVRLAAFSPLHNLFASSTDAKGPTRAR